MESLLLLKLDGWQNPHCQSEGDSVGLEGDWRFGQI